MSLISGCDDVLSEREFYENAAKYWKSIPASLNGMLGGYEKISNIDGKDARLKLNKALDCGAGIGRVSKGLLLPLFKTVDLVELNPKFLERAKTFLGGEASRVENYFCCGLQDLNFNGRKYDLIWIQWVTGHLTDEHFVRFLSGCKTSLADGGMIVIKDNVALQGVEHDDKDSSVTRNIDDLHAIYEKAALKILKEQQQTHFPAELYKVFMTALE